MKLRAFYKSATMTCSDIYEIRDSIVRAESATKCDSGHVAVSFTWTEVQCRANECGREKSKKLTSTSLFFSYHWVPARNRQPEIQRLEYTVGALVRTAAWQSRFVHLTTVQSKKDKQRQIESSLLFEQKQRTILNFFVAASRGWPCRRRPAARCRRSSRGP